MMSWCWRNMWWPDTTGRQRWFSQLPSTPMHEAQWSSSVEPWRTVGWSLGKGIIYIYVYIYILYYILYIYIYNDYTVEWIVHHILIILIWWDCFRIFAGSTMGIPINKAVLKETLLSVSFCAKCVRQWTCGPLAASLGRCSRAGGAGGWDRVA